MDVTQKEIVTAIVAGIVWALTYLYVRRYMNPETRENYMKFRDDAIYGGLAVAVAFMAKNLLGEFLDSRRYLY